MMRHNFRDQSGVTLVEVLITMGLLSIFLVVVATLFTTSVDVQLRSRGYAAVTNDGRFVLARLNYDIARASAVTTPASLGGSGSSLALTINGNTYTYAIANGRLQLTDTLGTDYLTGSDDTVSGLTFTKVGNTGGLEAVQYSFTLTSNGSDSGTTDTQTFSSTVERRS